MRKKIKNTAHIKLDTHLCKACWKCYDACQKDVFGKINILFGLQHCGNRRLSAECEAVPGKADPAGN